ncbi:Uncharacterised protein [uncultured archaeon]|nr:Uncharacterised protein [uncultured archaeon]
MRKLAIVAVLAVLCLIAAPVLGVADAKGYQTGPYENGHQSGELDGSGSDNGNGNQTGDVDGSGPDRDGSCQE